VLLRLPAGGRACTAGRPASYSARLGLLAASTGSAVALWDPRLGGNAAAADGAPGAAARPVARVPMPAGRAAAFVGLDRGHGTAAPPYHLLASTGAGVHVFDLRRLGACRAPASGVLRGGRVLHAPPPLVATFARPRAALGACFDALTLTLTLSLSLSLSLSLTLSLTLSLSLSLSLTLTLTLTRRVLRRRARRARRGRRAQGGVRVPLVRGRDDHVAGERHGRRSGSPCGA